MFGETLRVLVVADNPLTRAGLVAILEDQPDCEVVGQIDRSQVYLADAYTPDVLLWDLEWNQHLETLDYPIAVLLPDESRVGEMVAQGVQGVFLRSVEAGRLVAGLRAIKQGLFVAEMSVLAQISPQLDSLTDSLRENLTPRELEVLQLVAEGLANRAIAHALGISEHTVKFHINAIMGKLHAQSRTEAVVVASRLGLIRL